MIHVSVIKPAVLLSFGLIHNVWQAKCNESMIVNHAKPELNLNIIIRKYTKFHNSNNEFQSIKNKYIEL